MSYPSIKLRRGSERTLSQGHPWVYSGAVDQASKDLEVGAIVDVLDHWGRFIGRGYYNPRAAIRARILCRAQDQPVDRSFVQQRIEQAHQLRQTAPFRAHTNAYRLIHGESDGLPGLIVDYYAGFLSVQFHTAGMEGLRQLILDSLETVVQPKGIYERSDVGTRRAEGLNDQPHGLLRGIAPPDLVAVNEYGVQLLVDLYRGQKTGLFLDQRENRYLVQRLAPKGSVLNCFAYTGAFSAHALKGGAENALDIDLDPIALATGRQNLDANCPPQAKHQRLATNLFPYLEDLAATGPRFELVVLDPPALMRRKGAFKQTMGVYTMLNRNALRLVRNGGLLVTSSCSGRISYEDFFQVLRRAQVGAQVQTRIIAYNHHPADHPVDPNFPEGRYLKCIFARVWR